MIEGELRKALGETSEDAPDFPRLDAEISRTAMALRERRRKRREAFAFAGFALCAGAAAGVAALNGWHLWLLAALAGLTALMLPLAAFHIEEENEYEAEN